MYFIKYTNLFSSDFITIATTRPETMLGDTAIAINIKTKDTKIFMNDTGKISLNEEDRIKIIEDIID